MITSKLLSFYPSFAQCLLGKAASPTSHRELPPLPLRFTRHEKNEGKILEKSTNPICRNLQPTQAKSGEPDPAENSTDPPKKNHDFLNITPRFDRKDHQNELINQRRTQ